MATIPSFEHHLEEYEAWFETYSFAYQSEILAVQALMPRTGRGVEIGVGSGRFALPLGITEGVEPSPTMAAIARQRGITVQSGVAEALPYDDESYDFALMVTTICFVDDVAVSFREAWRILKPGGLLLIGLVDANSPIGQFYQQHKASNVFYRYATFYTTDEILTYLTAAGFGAIRCTQTLTTFPEAMTAIEQPQEDYGTCSFVVIRGTKQLVA